MTEIRLVLTAPDLASYDVIVVFTSGGKDSLACLIDLLERGVDPRKIELHHHLVDGDEEEGAGLMDWPITKAYVRAVAAELDLPLYFSWRAGGFEREMLRAEAPTAPVIFEDEGGLRRSAGGAGPRGTRLRFPQLSANLGVRWCSAALKIDVGAAMLRNSARFTGRRVLVVTGERAEESPARARYIPFEPHRTDARAGRLRRHVDHWRPIHARREERVWHAIRRSGLVPHPAYRIGFGRVSCAFCIFAPADAWATLRVIAPERFERIARYEARFGVTIRRGVSVRDPADKGRPYPAALARPDLAALALSKHWTGPVQLAEHLWALPVGAFGDSAGPT